MSRSEIKSAEIIGNTEHINIAKKFLGDLPNNIRIFIGYGVAGSGEYICGVNIIQHLFHRLNYRRGIVEVIAPASENFGFSNTSSLHKIMKLYNVVHLFKEDFLKVNLADGIELHFYDIRYFNKYKILFPEVELAIFPGIHEDLRSAFGWLGTFTYYFENKLTEIGKARRALYFNPFTLNYDAGSYGFFSQLKNQIAVVDSNGLALAYPVYAPDSNRVKIEIANMASYNAPLSRTLDLLFQSQAAGDITFSIYGVHSLKNPSYVLLNLILSAKKYAMQSNKGKPLRIFLMSPIADDHWKQLQDLFNTTSDLLPDTIRDKVRQTFVELETKTLFIDVTMDDNFTLAQHETQVFRLPGLPWPIFAWFFKKSTIAPVYEGANSANLLASGDIPRWGLPCAKRMANSKVEIFTVADEAELPLPLIKAMGFICAPVYISINQWKYGRSPLDRFVPIIAQFSNQTRLPKPPGNDRVAYAIALISEKKHCTELREIQDQNTQLDNCQLHEAILSSSYVVRLLNTTTIKGLGYGAFIGGCEAILESRYVKFSSEKAHNSARVMQLLTQSIYEFLLCDDSSYYTFNLHRTLQWFTIMWCELWLATSPGRTHFSQKAIHFLMFGLILLPRLVNSDIKTILFLLPMSLLFLTSLDAGRHSVKFISNKITFFPGLFMRDIHPIIQEKKPQLGIHLE